MRTNIFFLLVALLLCMASCIPTKRLTYLQEDVTENDSIIQIQVQQQPYRVQVNDVISIRVKAADQSLVAYYNPTSGEATSLGEGYYYDGFAVDRHGNIRLPKFGDINVLGRTTEDIREIIERKLLDSEDGFTEKAGIYVTVKLAGIRYTITGEIGSPGVKIELLEQLSLVDAISNAGGVPLTGDLTDIVIIRQYPGGQKVHHVDLTTITAFKSPYYYVQPNDLIVVNPLPQKSLGAGTTALDTFRTILTVVTALTTTVLLFIGLRN